MGTTAAADRYLENTLNKTANGTTINEVNMKSASEEPVIEKLTIINGLKIGYCMYGHGDTAMLFICGGVGCYKKDYPEELLRAFDPNVFKIVCIDPPGYGTSRPPDRKQEVNRCLKDSAFCIELMQVTVLKSLHSHGKKNCCIRLSMICYYINEMIYKFIVLVGWLSTKVMLWDVKTKVHDVICRKSCKE
ncbi:hypothetical protein AB6A40_010216 [Gnathostoma spinigerum]|uniref:AB hydrolase-1 domain-containing protein n=1 Tax=Gnathostoma spinigerum TaxID=75299 RepID=A0ABD6F224_9BILA